MRRAPPELRWPLNYRVVMRGWNWLFFKPGILSRTSRRARSGIAARYLVEGLGHCGACHTPKNMFGADRRGQAFGGGRVAGMFAPRLDGAERSGLKSWSVEDIVEYLQSGRNAKSHAGGSMAEVVVNSTSKMSDADVRAIAVYLKDLPAGRRSRRSPRRRRRRWRRRKDLQRRLRRLPRSRRHRARRGSIRRCPATPICSPPTALSTLRIILDGAQTVTTPRAPNTGIDAGLCRN